MTNNDTTVLFFKDLYKTLKAMPSDAAGVFMTALFAVANGEEPDLSNPIAAGAFHLALDQMLRLEEHRKGKSAAGKAGGLKSGEARNETKQNEADAKQSEANAKQNEADTKQSEPPIPSPYPTPSPDPSPVNKQPSVAERKAPTGPKENHVKAEVVAPLPPEIDSPQTAIEWENFVKLRKEKRKPLTDRARSMIMKDLVKFARGDPERAVKILQQSIRKGWTDIYDLKDNANFAKSINWEAV